MFYQVDESCSESSPGFAGHRDPSTLPPSLDDFWAPVWPDLLVAEHACPNRMKCKDKSYQYCKISDWSHQTLVVYRKLSSRTCAFYNGCYGNVSRNARHSPVLIFVVVVLVRIIDILVRHSFVFGWIERKTPETPLNLINFDLLRAAHNVTVGTWARVSDSNLFACQPIKALVKKVVSEHNGLVLPPSDWNVKLSVKARAPSL